MTPAIFGLLGVIVGGVLKGFVDLAVERGRKRTEARVAAMLVVEELMADFASLMELGKDQRWGALQGPRAVGENGQWKAYRAALAVALSPDEYATIAAAYNGTANLRSEVEGKPSTEQIPEAVGEVIATIYLTMGRALGYLGRLTHRPSRLRPRARRAFDAESKAHVDKLLEKDKHYQQFMAAAGRPKHGA